jgi:Zn finger protein HypA/HybF involved in hydrogenase expression
MCIAGVFGGVSMAKGSKRVKRTILEAQEVVRKRGGLLLSTEFDGWAKSPILVRCNECLYEWTTSLSTINSGRRTWCPKCGGSKPQTHEEVKGRLLALGIALKSPYSNNKVPVEVECLKCGHCWKARPSDMLKAKDKTGCPRCHGGARRDYQDIKAVVEKDGYSVLISTGYINAHQKLEVFCTTCKRLRYQTFDKIQQGKGCVFCAGKVKKTIEEVAAFGQSLGFTLVSGEYVNIKSTLSWRCENGHILSRTLSNLRARSCPECHSGRSKPQFELLKIVKLIYKEFEVSDNYRGFKWLRHKASQEIDIFIHGLKIAIEYNGVQHYKPVSVFGGEKAFKNQVTRDRNKYKLIRKHKDDVSYFLKIKYTTPINLESVLSLLVKNNIPIPEGVIINVA